MLRGRGISRNNGEHGDANRGLLLLEPPPAGKIRYLSRQDGNQSFAALQVFKGSGDCRRVAGRSYDPLYVQLIQQLQQAVRSLKSLRIHHPGRRGIAVDVGRSKVIEMPEEYHRPSPAVQERSVDVFGDLIIRRHPFEEMVSALDSQRSREKVAGIHGI